MQVVVDRVAIVALARNDDDQAPGADPPEFLHGFVELWDVLECVRAHDGVEARIGLHVDAVAGSTFPSACCPGFRGLGERVPVVRFDDLEEFLSKQRIDVGGDIHSVSECAAFAVASCLQLFSSHRVSDPMRVPSPGDHRSSEFLMRECDGRDLDFGKTVDAAGGRLRSAAPSAPGIRASRSTFHLLCATTCSRGPAFSPWGGR